MIFYAKCIFVPKRQDFSFYGRIFPFNVEWQ
nr:MAG TPA: hypothetical protein [Caudoviricetes sp.]